MLKCNAVSPVILLCSLSGQPPPPLLVQYCMSAPTLPYAMHAVYVPPRPELLAFMTDFQADSALQWKLYNYTYLTMMAMFGNLTLNPQVREGGKENSEGRYTGSSMHGAGMQKV